MKIRFSNGGWKESRGLELAAQGLELAGRGSVGREVSALVRDFTLRAGPPRLRPSLKTGIPWLPGESMGWIGSGSSKEGARAAEELS